MNRIVPNAATLAATSLAHARPGTAYLEFDITTPDGDPIVEPGESARLTVSCRMVGDHHLVAYGGCIVDVLGGDGSGALTGHTILNNLDDVLD